MRLIATSVLVLLASTTAARAGKVGPDGWEQIADKDGVKVFRKSVAGSPLKSMKGVGIVDVPVATVALVLLDDPRAHEWVDSLAESRVVRMVNPHEYIEYNHIAMPAICRDREFVTRVTLESRPAEKVAIIRSAPADDPSIAHNKKIIRGDLISFYQLRSIDDGKRTELTIEMHTDPKGWLPAWVVNLFQKDWALETIGGIRKQCKKPDLKTPSEFATYLDELKF
ncbi:MAG TPA: START domain-containing protein [Polyangia bacterium]|jgi:hypothetical protein|nr:START domain-containing protein [Polyangia bacterium]